VDTTIVSPTLLYLLLFTNISNNKLIYIGKIAVALTFLCHGLYAIGYYPLPGQFVDMMINGFFVNQEQSVLLLKVFGIIDILIALTIFLPITTSISLWYAILWGTLTALARVTTNFYIDFPWQSLNQWIPEMLYRIPHGSIPLFVLFLYQSVKLRQSSTNPSSSFRMSSI